MNSFKQFRKTKSATVRGKLIAEWVHETLGRLPAVTDEHCDRARLYMMKALEDSRKFCGRPIEGDTRLHRDWFKVLVANGSDNPKVRQFFQVIGWDFDTYHNPTWSVATSLMEVGGGVKLLMESTGHFPNDSVWSNRKSGKLWKILCSDIGDGVVEFEPFGKHNNSKKNMLRNAGSINKFLKREKSYE